MNILEGLQVVDQLNCYDDIISYFAFGMRSVQSPANAVNYFPGQSPRIWIAIPILVRKKQLGFSTRLFS